MNQQRSRRFRTARDAEEARRKAISKGEELPKEAAFDSNCITPGSEFMTRLSEQLKYFIAKKISEDASWAKIKVILSGHEVPGEGEHKVMEYIRAYKSSPDYLPNTRHCLYGLDADLILLGLLSHEPHFALLREEVTFGKGKKKTGATSNPDNQNFYLMYLSIFREYLDMEFSPLKGSLNFEYDLERIIDDFILLSFFVGNDFLPHLPGLHINDGALASFFNIYKTTLTKSGGYINSEGWLNLDRLEQLLKGISLLETDQFAESRVDLQFIDSKRGKKNEGPQQRSLGRNGDSHVDSLIGKNTTLVLTRIQSEYYLKIKEFVLQRSFGSRLKFPTNIPTRDRKFIMTLAKELGVSHGIHSDGDESDKEQKLNIWWDSDDDESDEESTSARMRIIKKYDKATVMEDDEIAAAMAVEAQAKFESEFAEWKRSYYKEKLEFDPVQRPDALSNIVFKYVEGLQWLMGVLPVASQTLIPPVYRDLMTDPNSPIADFYPLEFELDLNGKKQDWEAVVKIPFIDEKRLIRALEAREAQLTQEERRRNSFGQAVIFEKITTEAYLYPSSLPGVFPDIAQCTAGLAYIDIRSPLNPKCGLMPGTFLGASMLSGFPSLHTLPITGTLGFHGVNVFNSESVRESMVVTIGNQYETQGVDDIALKTLGSRVFVGWPFLCEALVTSVMDELFTYSIRPGSQHRELERTPHNQRSQDRFYNNSERIDLFYSKRFGTLIGPIEITVGVRLLKGLKLGEDGSLIKDFGSEGSSEVDYALQTVITGVEHEDPRMKEMPPPPLTDEFPLSSQIFFLGNINYGCMAEVKGHMPDGLCIRLWRPLTNSLLDDLNVTRNIAISCEQMDRYLPSFKVSKAVGLSSLVLSKITSSLQVISKKGDQKFNIGLNLKFEGKGKKVLGFTRKSENGWEYSQRALDLIKEYKDKFPEVFSGLERKARNDLYDEHDFFSREAATERTAQLKEWLKVKGVRDFDRVSLDARALPKEFIRQIESAVDGLYASNAEMQSNKSIIVKNVPRVAVLKPSHAKHRLSHQTFELGERILNVSDVGSVPVAARGTIIGINGKFLDVIFDFPFMGGNTLEGRCSTSRAMSVHKDTVLNTTRPQPPKSVVDIGIPKPPERIPGKPLLSAAEREARTTGSRFVQDTPPKVVANAWERGVSNTVTSAKPFQPSKVARPELANTDSPTNAWSNSRVEPPRRDVRPSNAPLFQESKANAADALTASLKNMLHIGDKKEIPAPASTPRYTLNDKPPKVKADPSFSVPAPTVQKDSTSTAASQTDIASQILANLRADVPSASSVQISPYAVASKSAQASGVKHNELAQLVENGEAGPRAGGSQSGRGQRGGYHRGRGRGRGQFQPRNQ
ncbi:hypothetical protein HDU67_002555 [Dinochytrium kinnereticum]|nr:hypothetical protein HDU67_002555 [Dinochytrium kinnereticum]